MLTIREFQELLDSLHNIPVTIYRDMFQNWVITSEKGVFTGHTLLEAIEDFRLRGI